MSEKSVKNLARQLADDAKSLNEKTHALFGDSRCDAVLCQLCDLLDGAQTTGLHPNALVAQHVLVKRGRLEDFIVHHLRSVGAVLVSEGWPSSAIPLQTSAEVMRWLEGRWSPEETRRYVLQESQD